MKKIFVTGLLTILPLAVTLYIFYLIFSGLENLMDGPIKELTGMYLPGTGFVVGILIIFLVGFVATSFVGRRLIAYGDLLFQKIPLAKVIYSSVKQIVDAFASRERSLFQRVVLLEYPRAGLYTMGFVTGESRGEVQTRTREEIINVFVPTTPNPTSGLLILVPEKEVIELDMSVEEGIKLIISGGMLTPSV